MNYTLLKQIARKVYKCEDWRDWKRYYVFLARCTLNSSNMEKHLAFFNASEQRKQMMLNTPYFIDQVTRVIFWKGSSFEERADFVQNHINKMEQLFKPELLDLLYVKCHRVLLYHDTFEDKPLNLFLVFRDGQQKEGCLSIELILGSDDLENTDWDSGTHVYQIMFTLGDKCPAWPDAKADNLAIHIGALQGLLGGSETIKRMTKAYFGYRPKNLIFWCMRCIAEAINADRITAITNNGYYAMNHLRLNRKLKVDLDQFWEECQGVPQKDKRFYDLPIPEYRKDMSELKPSKRAQHRKRFEKLDEIKAQIESNLKKYMK